MILTELRDYLRSRSYGISMTELSSYFNKSPHDLLPLLDYWLAKGRIESVASTCSGACSRCPLRCTQYYRYVAAENPVYS